MGINDDAEQPESSAQPEARHHIPEHVELFRPTTRVNPSKLPSFLDALDKSRASKAEKKHAKAVAKARKERLAAEARAAIQAEAEQRAAEKVAREAIERADLEARKAEVRAERAARVAADEAAATEARVREAAEREATDAAQAEAKAAENEARAIEAQLLAAEKQAAAEEKAAADAAAAELAQLEKAQLEKARLAEEAKHEKAREAALVAAEAKLIKEKKVPKVKVPKIKVPKIKVPKINKRVAIAVGSAVGVVVLALGIWLGSLQYIRPTLGMKTDKGPAASIVAATDHSTSVETGDTVVALLAKQPDGKEITIMGTVRSKNTDTVFVSGGNTIWSVKPNQIMGKVLFTLPRG